MPKNNNRNSLKVLIVDDHKSNRQLMATLLRPYDFECHYAENGKIALENCKKKSFDLVLLDLEMPELDGFETAKVLRATSKKQVIIAMSASNIPAADEKSVKAGCNSYYDKPLGAFDIAEILEKHFDIQNDFMRANVQSILVVDDDVSSVLLFRTYLHNSSIRVMAANSAETALEVIQRQYDRGQFFVAIFVDYRLPNMNGLELVKAIRERFVLLADIYMLSSFSNFNENELQDLQITRVLTKPIDEFKILKIISAYSENNFKLADIDERIKAIIPDFIVFTFEDLAKAKKALSSNDFEALSTIGHSLKGSAGGYGLPYFSKIGQQIEAAALKKNIVALTTIITEFEDSLMALQREFSKADD